MTIIITYKNGSTQTFTGCSGYTEGVPFTKFNGQLAGHGAAKDWSIATDAILTVSRETAGD